MPAWATLFMSSYHVGYPEGPASPVPWNSSRRAPVWSSSVKPLVLKPTFFLQLQGIFSGRFDLKSIRSFWKSLRSSSTDRSIRAFLSSQGNGRGQVLAGLSTVNPFHSYSVHKRALELPRTRLKGGTFLCVMRNFLIASGPWKRKGL